MNSGVGEVGCQDTPVREIARNNGIGERTPPPPMMPLPHPTVGRPIRAPSRGSASQLRSRERTGPIGAVSERATPVARSVTKNRDRLLRMEDAGTSARIEGEANEKREMSFEKCKVTEPRRSDILPFSLVTSHFSLLLSSRPATPRWLSLCDGAAILHE